MNTKALSREEKERLYIAKSNELQRTWKNPIDPNYDDQAAVRQLTDRRLDELLSETIGQIRFEKALGTTGMILKVGLALFVGLGVVGLLLFGIRQLFG
jgi:hypothetical protein